MGRFDKFNDRKSRFPKYIDYTENTNQDPGVFHSNKAYLQSVSPENYGSNVDMAPMQYIYPFLTGSCSLTSKLEMRVLFPGSCEGKVTRNQQISEISIRPRIHLSVSQFSGLACWEKGDLLPQVRCSTAPRRTHRPVCSGIAGGSPAGRHRQVHDMVPLSQDGPRHAETSAISITSWALGHHV